MEKPRFAALSCVSRVSRRGDAASRGRLWRQVVIVGTPDDEILMGRFL